ncbi:MAG: type I DNA topoisomerase [Deltaproteobacteria bacterium]|nr:type I DNA topoisomerase [Deltaproteobacteria bacterium]
MSRVLIVESPGKLKTLKKILGAGWQIEASVGHTTELAYDGPKRLGFEFKEGKVITHYVPRGDRGKEVLGKLRKVVKDAEMVYLATDPDREGEAIAWHLVDQLKLKRYCRVAYTQITDAAVKKAIANPITLNTSLIESQRARQCLDKLVGFEVSPLLWNSTGGKSAGRVQSATLHLICERERERLNFKPEKYWLLKSVYNEGFEALYEIAAQAVAPAPNVAARAGEAPGDLGELEKNRVRTEEEAKRIEAIARSSEHVVEATEQKIEPRNPPPPLITSSLQQVAGARYKFSPKHTMKVAQELYEGIDGKGLITYMRTDSTALSNEFVDEARAWLSAHAPEALPDKAPVYKTKADAQGAHEAIRPTSAELTPEKARAQLSPDQLKLYTLVWERAIACQCKPARLSKTKITVAAASTRWIARGTTIVEPGYLRFWKNLEEEKQLPLVQQGQKLKLDDVKTASRETQPPPRYSEPRLVQLMERKGIGRPSTYASTIATLKDREYVVLEQNLMAPTKLGMATDEALSKALPDLVDTDFTARMETALDDIAEGKASWEKYLTEWSSGYLAPAVVKAREILKGVARVEGAPSGTGAGPGTDSGNGYRSTGNGPGSGSGPGPMSEVRERLAKATLKAQKNGAHPTCPKGHGPLILKLSKKDTFYWKCMFPECDAISWYADFSREKCPACDSPMEKIPSKKVTGGYFLKCSKKASHGEEVLFFKNRKTKEWEQAKGPRGPLRPPENTPSSQS